MDRGFVEILRSRTRHLPKQVVGVSLDGSDLILDGHSVYLVPSANWFLYFVFSRFIVVVSRNWVHLVDVNSEFSKMSRFVLQKRAKGYLDIETRWNSADLLQMLSLGDCLNHQLIFICKTLYNGRMIKLNRATHACKPDLCSLENSSIIFDNS